MIIFGFFIILIGLIMLIYCILISKHDSIRLISRKNDPSICFLLPARDESKVISGLLESIANQTYTINMRDVYLIVEDSNDKSINISKEYGCSIIIREELNKRTKGYALDEALHNIEKYYDMYFIFDADNVLDNNFVNEMIVSYHQGYDIGVGYRNSKNGNVNVIASCSSLTFSMINQLFNKMRVKKHNNVTISGTGFYIVGDYIKKWKGYIFHSMTEDYELTLYSILNGMSSTYNSKAIFYDEQPTNMKLSLKQRTRWVKGFFESRKKYIPLIKKSLKMKKSNDGCKKSTIYTIRSIIIMLIGLMIILVNYIYTNFLKLQLIIYLLSFLIAVYFILLVFSWIIIKSESKILHLSKKMKYKSLFFNPIFLFSYLICVFRFIFKRDIGWDKIEHTSV